MTILEQSINLLTDDGILVNLSPIRWLQDPLAKYKKTSDWYKFKEVREHTHIINVIIARDFQAMFGAIGNFDLGIYVIKKSVSPTPVSVINPVIERMSEFNHSNPAPLELDKYEIDINEFKKANNDFMSNIKNRQDSLHDIVDKVGGNEIKLLIEFFKV